MSDAVPVAVTGWTWTATLMGVANLLIGGLLVAIVKSRPALKKIANEREASLLSERAAEMDLMRKRIDLLEAELRATNHKLNNVTQAFEWLVDTIEFNPDRAKEAASKARQMRTTQMQAEATEKSAIHAAALAQGKGTPE